MNYEVNCVFEAKVFANFETRCVYDADAYSVDSISMPCCNPVYPHVYVGTKSRPESVLNAAARFVCHYEIRERHDTDVLVRVHWSRVSERINYKIVVLTHKLK